MIGELIAGIIEGLAKAIVEGVAASKEAQEKLLLRVENLLRVGADAVASARVSFSQEDATTQETFAEARKRIADASK